ncbi:acyl-CoA dehydrogenase family protein [Amycolatopsis sp. OK19-0408]|uniref:Acyl-[acyl-carrier-protein] dehydrogenase MbtN n=1 Tax=Amycolatopsis iheyensis TaxID=2945988 RepID=A0A9X2N904_9PSEU|nr:acyl-CoA dehydrogenase family protein [Amycolatopsis iheyensis]MCR6483507.1 acyl-CoA dehydrogenase family protein [Amycolatopsis iheyensis]
MPEQAVEVQDVALTGGGREIWAALGAAGALRSAYRGGDPALGVDPAGLGRLLSEVDAQADVGATLSLCVQLATAVPLLATGSGPAEVALADALAGTSVTALAATDTTAGSDLTALGTEVVIGEDELVLRGGKRWITNATQADQLLVLARHRPGRHFTSFTWVLVPASAAGVTASPADTELFEGAGVGRLTFEDVRLPREHLVGRPGRGLAGFARQIAVERLAGALWAVALCRRALVATKTKLEDPTRSDEPLWRHESVRQRFAECVVAVRQLDALCRELGDRVAGRHDTAAAALLKAGAGMTAERVLAECARLQGADGFAAGGAQWLRAQAAVFGIGGGVTEVVLSAVADSADTLLAETGG